MLGPPPQHGRQRERPAALSVLALSSKQVPSGTMMVMLRPHCWELEGPWEPGVLRVFSPPSFAAHSSMGILRKEEHSSPEGRWVTVAPSVSLSLGEGWGQLLRSTCPCKKDLLKDYFYQ